VTTTTAALHGPPFLLAEREMAIDAARRRSTAGAVDQPRQRLTIHTSSAERLINRASG